MSEFVKKKQVYVSEILLYIAGMKEFLSIIWL